MAIILAIRALRTVVSPTPENLATLYLFVDMLTPICILEIVTLLAQQRAAGEGRAMGGALWYLNIVAEFLFPAIAIVTITSSSIPFDYRALINPSFLMYFLLLTLTVLRLNPRLSLLCGFFAAATDLWAGWHDGWRPGNEYLGASLYSPQKTVVTFTCALIPAGFVVALVARQFRTQVEAALREAETLEMGPGDLHLLATDGFFEWANVKEERFGTGRLEASLRASCNKPAAEIISNLYQDVLKFAGGAKQMDDLTAIVLKRVD